MTRRTLKWIGWILGVLIGLPCLTVGFILVFANIDVGRRIIERETASLTGGIVHIEGLAGRFPDALRAAKVEVADARGTYVTIAGLSLDWSPRKLLDRTAFINALTADRVDFTRLPVSDSQSSSSGGSFTLPVTVDIARLQIGQAHIGAAVMGTAATLSLAGSGELQTLTEGTVHLDARRLDSPGHYSVNGTVAPDAIEASMTATEPAKGLISQAAHLPDLGAISIQASVNGPRDSLATEIGINAGQLTASASGTVDLVHEAANLGVKATAPAMAPAPDVAWQSVLVDATLRGPFIKPDASGTVRIDALTASGVRVRAIAADIKGNAGQASLHASVDGLVIPGPQPDMFAAAPVVLDVTAGLDAPDRPVTFSLRHPLLSIDGSARTDIEQQGRMHVVIPDLRPFAAAGGTNLQGSTDLTVTAARHGDTTDATATGRIALTGGVPQAVALVGDDGRIDVAGSMNGQDFKLSKLTVNGRAMAVSAQGGLSGQTVALDWTLGLPDLAAVQTNIAGKLDATGHVAGTLQDLAVQAELGADLSANGYQSGHITARINATGLPHAPHATVTAGGTLLDAPLSVALTADKSERSINVAIDRTEWKSLKAQGDVSLLPSSPIPVGHLSLNLGRLADLRPLLGRPINGQVEASLDSDTNGAKLLVNLRDTVIPGTAAVSRAVLNATVTDPTGHPAVEASLTASGVSAGTVKSATARITAKGPRDAIAVTVAADVPDLMAAAAKVTAGGTVNGATRQLALTRLEATWKQAALKLLAPANFSFADGVTIDRLRLGLGQAVLAVSGSAGSKLDLTATLQGLPADIGTIVQPSLAADGVIAADMRLTGTSTQPTGTVKLTATNVRLRQGPGRGLPPANLAVNVVLAGTSARIDTRLTAGPSHLAVTGTAPISRTGRLDLKADGQVDLTMLDPVLAAQGQRARGTIALDAGVTGTLSAPNVQGQATLRDGDVTDFARGIHLTDLSALVQASGDTIRLANFTGKAGPGTLGGNGTLGLSGAMPVDLHFTADNAQPLASDLMTAQLDANLTLQGDIKGKLDASGTIHIRKADIRIPDKLPASVAVLPVRLANAPPPPPAPAAPPSIIALNLTLDAPQQVFIRGRGLDAELGGVIHIHGTADAPVPDGGFHLRRGTFSVVGTTLTFTTGTIDFSGDGLTDPSIDFVATSTSSSITATLTISGSAKNPKITLSSVPELPQDEILSQLLFNTSTSKLSPFQLAEIAAALASFSGATGGFDPLESVRNTLGLDRLSVGSNSNGAASVQAGRYIARGVYVGAQQDASGTGTQATVQVDLAKGLTLQTTAGSGSTSATGSTSSADSASIGLKYQFEY